MAVLMNPDGSPISLFFQQIWCEIDLISGDYLNAELSQGILTVKEAEQLVGRLVVQLFISCPPLLVSSFYECDSAPYAEDHRCIQKEVLRRYSYRLSFHLA